MSGPAEETTRSPRSILVQPPDGVREGFAVLRVSLALAVCLLLWAGLHGWTPRERALLLPHQVLFETLEPLEQTLLRECRAALDEICTLFQEQGSWPSGGALGEELITPFAPVLLAGLELRYEWRETLRDGRASYQGEPDSAMAPALLLVVEPARATTDPDHRALEAADESHLKLADGRVVHYGLWLHAGRGLDPAPPRPELAGWRQVVARRRGRRRGGVKGGVPCG